MHVATPCEVSRLPGAVPVLEPVPRRARQPSAGSLSWTLSSLRLTPDHGVGEREDAGEVALKLRMTPVASRREIGKESAPALRLKVLPLS